MMELEDIQFLPDPSLSRGGMERIQREIAREAVFKDEFGFPRSLEGVTIAGVDQAFLDDRAVSGVVVMEDDEVIERVHGSAKLEIPYIPGLLAFREGGCIIDALESLSIEPDLLVLDGSGRIHFRQAGIATHIGVLFDKPAVGVAKNLLCGKPAREFDYLEEGERVRILADSSLENVEGGTTIGYAVQSRQYPNPEKRSVNPLYVSPGHHVSEETAVDLVEKLCHGYKLPEPTRLADRYVDEVRQGL